MWVYKSGNSINMSLIIAATIRVTVLVTLNVLQEERNGREIQKKRERRAKRERLPDPFWEDASGIHTSLLVPGEPPTGTAEQITEEFQKRIKNSIMVWENCTVE